MGNNKEIRQRMETYRNILLVLNWIGAVGLLIWGIVLATSRDTRGTGIGVIIGSIIIGIIGHFLINVALVVPFILLNNGDILESLTCPDLSVTGRRIHPNPSNDRSSLIDLKGNKGSSSGSNSSNTASVNSNPNIVNYGDYWLCKKCDERNPNTAPTCKGCGAYK
ncbi:hypothetical protein K7I13_11845 [Brucepastera parasyntrophica]|uniref:hypothetical protein n=1 Tax=Brucepastera parasyntrophica TaxID=2880008 RepID=UPI00210951A7|nr:hypothetical protein [Brucepastera parasyntrophica]ULQ59181.1 hypothetical protein K7I13_11845 [Brucepastera parasyntrophica]